MVMLLEIVYTLLVLSGQTRDATFVFYMMYVKLVALPYCM
jgi:hypothetical protein